MITQRKRVRARGIVILKASSAIQGRDFYSIPLNLFPFIDPIPPPSRTVFPPRLLLNSQTMATSSLSGWNAPYWVHNLYARFPLVVHEQEYNLVSRSITLWVSCRFQIQIFLRLIVKDPPSISYTSSSQIMGIIRSRQSAYSTSISPERCENRLSKLGK